MCTMLISVLTALLFLITVSQAEKRKFISLADHLWRLTEKEAGEIRAFCEGPEERITGGGYYDGHPNYVAVIVNATDRTALCGATFISKWHLVTGRSCIDQINGPNDMIEVYAGGNCLNDSQNCLWTNGTADMIKLEWKFGLFDRERIADAGDLAIIQLYEPVPEEYRRNISFACLPHANQPLPSMLTLFGWGSAGNDADKPRSGTSLNHRYTYALKWLNMSTVSENVDPSDPCYPTHLDSRFCTSPMNKNEEGLYSNAFSIPRIGDYGGGSFEIGRRPVIFGVYTYGLNRFTDYNVFHQDLRLFIDDFCTLINLCVPGAASDVAIRIRPTGVVYSKMKKYGTVAAENGLHPNLEDPSKYLSKCEEKRKQRQADHADWAAALVDASNRIVCAATFITGSHLLTSRDCVTDYLLDAAKMKDGLPTQPNINDTLLYVRPNGECRRYSDKHNNYECRLITVVAGFRAEIRQIAWGRHLGEHPWRSDIAIVELSKKLPEGYALPVCLDPVRFNLYQYYSDPHFWPSDLNGFYWPVNATQQSRSPFLLYAENPPNNPDWIGDVFVRHPKNLTLLRDQDAGTAIVDASTHDLLGIVLRSNAAHPPLYRVYPAESLYDMLCVFLNRCVEQKYSYRTPYISHFTTFYEPKYP